MSLSCYRTFGEEEDEYPTLEEALAIELMMHDNEHGYFAGNLSEQQSFRYCIYFCNLALKLNLFVTGV